MRRDLRLHDHAALATALAGTAPIQPVFLFDRDILVRFANPDDRRLGFLMRALCQIDAELKARGGRLLVLYGSAIDIMPKLAQALHADAIFSAEDFEPATIARDAGVKQALAPQTRFVQVLDHLLCAPQKLHKSDGTPYKVFTPFYKYWRSLIGPDELAEYTVNDRGRYADDAAIFAAVERAGITRVMLDGGPAQALAQIDYRFTVDALWPVDDAAQRLKNFTAMRLQNYPIGRDALAEEGTSRISPYLRFGLLSIRECMRAALEAGGGEKWIGELGWREFYAAILFHFPHAIDQEFIPHYRDGAIPWNRDPTLITAFCEGRTGFPIVDAAVRELLTTGFMHNRARMIVASFASKDLLLDWRIGENFFAQHLMDYELASNNGGWQWSASTGTDAAPYFRIFNPTTQSQRFDPNGDYIRRYVPELRDMPTRDIHAPPPLIRPKNYPVPIVEHSAARERAIAVFKSAGNARGLAHFVP